MGTRARRRQDHPWNPPGAGPDISTIFVLFAVGSLLLPVVGANATTISFAVTLVLLVLAAVRAFGASRRAPERRSEWLCFMAAAIVAGLASAAALGTGAGVPDTAAYYVGSGGSLALAAGCGRLARHSLREVSFDRALDALLLALVVVGLSIYFLAVPGFRHGDPLLTAGLVIGLAAGFAAVLAVIASGGVRRRMTTALLAMCGAVALGDAVASATAAGQLEAAPWVVGCLWGLGAVALGIAAGLEDGRPAGPVPEPESRWIYARVIAPLAAALAFPLAGAGVWLAGALEPWALGYFGGASVLVLVLAFGRQARLLVENRRAMTRERALREEVMRRNDDLEALTGLATTMTQTLEELPIVERGLEVLHLAARTSGAALHMHDEQGPRLAVAAGRWQGDSVWCELPRGPAYASLEVTRRGAREILRLPLAARGHRIGVVTLIRPDEQPYRESEIDLLRILGDQLAIAIQNARDYREKLEQAVRDPLTGVYNRRYFFEALDKEVKRVERYGSNASLVIFDIDDFKRINDTLGHAAGDEALRRVADVVRDVIRDVDSFARIGGEEFALLLPEAPPLDALLVAERVRTAIAREEILKARRVTVSGGVSSCPHDGQTREVLQQKADAALYWAKRNGKNICALASEAASKAVQVEDEGMLTHLAALVSTIDAEHLHSRDHSENVAASAVAIAQELGLPADQVIRLRRAGLFHDIGKIAVSSDVLGKEGDLDDDEYERVKLHPGVGATMLLHAGFPDEAGWVRAHHERFDGAGYPDGLAADAIPLEGRILFVAEAFEAMTAGGPHRSGVDAARALVELRRCAGTQFDPIVVEALGRLVERGTASPARTAPDREARTRAPARRSRSPR